MTRISPRLNVWVVLLLAALSALASLPSEARRFFNERIDITEYVLDGRVNMPLHLDFDEDGNLWVGAFRDGKILRYSYNGETQVYDVEAQDIDPAKGPMNMYADNDGSVWFSAIGNYIVNLQVDGTLTYYSIPSDKSMPMGIRGDSLGDIWFSEMFTGKIGVIRRATGEINEFDIPNRLSLPTGIAVDKYDNKWFAMAGVGKIGVLRANGTFNEYNLPIGAHPMGISRSKHQKSDLVWFTETVGNKIGSITTNGTIKLYRIPTLASMPMMVMEDEFGDVWFTEMAANQIGKLNVSDGSYRVTEYKIPTAMSAPMGLAMHPHDGSVWFTEVMRNRIGTFTAMP